MAQLAKESSTLATQAKIRGLAIAVLFLVTVLSGLLLRWTLVSLVSLILMGSLAETSLSVFSGFSVNTKYALSCARSPMSG